MNKIILFFSFIAITPKLFPCDCPRLPQLHVDSIKQYDVIFKGKIDSLSINNDVAIAWFTIDNLFKGNSFKTNGVYFDNISSCQLKMDKGDEWIIYAEYKSFGKIGVNNCSRSRKYFADLKDDYYSINNGMTYSEEFAFLESNFSSQAFMEKEAETMIKRELIHPSRPQMLYWLLASLIGFLIIYFLFKKFVK